MGGRIALFDLADLEQAANGEPNANGLVAVQPDALSALIEVVRVAGETWTYIHALTKVLPDHQLRHGAVNARQQLSIALNPFEEGE